MCDPHRLVEEVRTPHSAKLRRRPSTCEREFIRPWAGKGAFTSGMSQVRIRIPLRSHLELPPGFVSLDPSLTISVN
jgi:hypothetical protein